MAISVKLLSYSFCSFISKVPKKKSSVNKGVVDGCCSTATGNESYVAAVPEAFLG